MFDQREVQNSKIFISENLKYSGKGLELALLMYKNFALTILTFGIYAAWGRTNTRRYLWNNVSFMGDRAAYLGTGKELFRGWCVVALIYMIVMLGIKILSFILPQSFNFLWLLLFLPAYLYIYSLVVYGGTRYRLSCTKWREIRFGMRRNHSLTKQFIWLNIKGVFLSVITLGIYFPRYQNEKRRFLVNQSQFGTGKFFYAGSNSKYVMLFAKNVLFTVLTLGLYSSWMVLNLKKFAIENTSFNNSLFFKLRLKGSDIFVFSFVSYFATVLTLGLALPWIVNRWQHMIINSIEVFGEIDFTTIQNDTHTVRATGDVASVLFDIDLGF